MPHQEINPPELNDYATEFAVAHGVVAGDTLYLSGQAAIDPGFEVSKESFEEQASQVFDQLTLVLQHAAFSWDDVVKLTSYINTQDRTALWTYARVLKEYLSRYSSRSSVAHTYILCEMHHTQAMIEVEGIAVRST